MNTGNGQDWTAPLASNDNTALTGHGADWGFTPAPAPTDTVLIFRTRLEWAGTKVTFGTCTYYVPEGGYKAPEFGSPGYLIDPLNWA